MEKKNNQEYLDNLVEELLTDQEWELPAELRIILESDLAWGLLAL